MNEKDLLERLKDSASQVTPPESLHPKNIETLLDSQPKPESGQQVSPLSSHKKASPRRRLSVYRLGGLAAAFAVTILASWQAGRLSALDASSSVPAPQAQSLAAESEAEAEIQVLAEAAGGSAKGAGTSSDLPENEPDSAASQAASSDLAADDADSAASENALASGQAAPEAEAAPEAAEVPLTEAIDPVDSYETVYQALYDTFGGSSMDMGIAAYGARTETASDIAVEKSAVSADLSASPLSANSGSTLSFSATNTQEVNVDEGDVVKTDGTWIYILKESGSVIILDADQEETGREMSETARINLEQGHDPLELYVDKDRLSVVTSEYYTEMDDSDENVIASRSGTRTWLFTYDISDRENPLLEGSVSLDGAYSQSRKNGDYIYLFSRYTPTILDTYEDSSVVPLTSQGQLSPSQIYLPDELSYTSYLVAVSVNIHDPGEIVDQKAVVSVASTFYASEESIYIANENWDNSQVRTNLLKLSYRDGIIVGTAAGYLDGYLNDSFSLSEYEGYLRAVTTSYDENYNESNGLYILDENLKLVGSISDLAPDETVRSARFLGNTGYFVTFRQTDPLFSVDLSDPANPRIMGDLKISGFSTYLHFYSDNLLLGLGYEADEDTGIQTGLKLSMFDISDPSNVTEAHRLVLDGITWCEALEDYKSILIDPQKNLFGFLCDNRYLVFSYDEEKGFVSEFIYDFYRDIINDGALAAQAEKADQEGVQDDRESSQADASTPTDSMDIASYLGADSAASYTRGLYINDTLYLVRSNRVLAFDMADGYRLTGERKLG